MKLLHRAEWDPARRKCGFPIQPFLAPTIHRGQPIQCHDLHLKGINLVLLAVKLATRASRCCQEYATLVVNRATIPGSVHEVAMPLLVHRWCKISRGVMLHRGRRSANQSVNRGRVHHVTAEEAQEAPDIVLGTLKVNSVPATVLFDSGASHSFISLSFVEAQSLPLNLMNIPMVIHAPGAEMKTVHECRNVSIEIQGLTFLATLILLKTSGLDVILGMNWLRDHQALINCVTGTVSLVHPSGYQLEVTPKLLSPHLYALEGRKLPELE